MNKKMWITIGAIVAAVAVIVGVVLAILLSKGNDNKGDESKPNVSSSAESDTNTEKMVVTAGSAEGKNGETVSVAITVDSNPGFMASLFDIKYDNTVLEYISYEAGDIISDYQFAENDGYLRFLNAEDSNVTDNGTMFTLKFKVIGESGDSSDIALEIADIINYDEQDVAYTAVNGTVKVK